MGIINLTPDSFFDGNPKLTESEVLKRMEGMIGQGAEMIDLGAYSSRPGADHIDTDEEWSRIQRFLPGMRKEFPDVLLSLDTFRSDITKRAADLGIDMINDISGGILDGKMIGVVAELKLPYVIMHMKGEPRNMQHHPTYEDVVDEVFDFLTTRGREANAAGISSVILDPGFGFGKDLSHNYQLLSSLRKFSETGHPLMIGISRKSMINQVLGTSPDTALNGSTVLHTIALLNGAQILRVHDVEHARQARDIVSYMQKA